MGNNDLLVTPEGVLSCRAGELQFAKQAAVAFAILVDISYHEVTDQEDMWRMCRIKARGHSRETAFAKPMGEEKSCSSYRDRPWACLACSSHFKAYPILRESVIGQACSALLFVINVKQWDVGLF